MHSSSSTSLSFHRPGEPDDDADDDAGDDYEDAQRPVLGFHSEDTATAPGAGGSAMEYLQQVRAEARRCPQVVVAAAQPPLAPSSTKSKMAKSRQARSAALAWPDAKCSALAVSAAASTPHDVGAATPEWAPKLAWQNDQLAAFAEVRDRLAAAAAAGKAAAPMEKKRSKSSKSLPASSLEEPLPRASDERGWRQFCFGGFGAVDCKTESDEEGEAEDDDEAEQEADGEERQASDPEGRPPLVSLVLRLPRATVLALIRHHTRWLASAGFSDQAGRWLYALLAALQKPLLADEVDVLRRLGRACRRERLRLPGGGPQHPAALPLCLFVCLVARCFDQLDLADP